MFKFRPISEFKPGTIFSLLSASFGELWNEELEAKINNFDREVFKNPQTIGACTFITTLGNEPAGMGSYDPRQGPELGILGYNCVIPEFQGKGLGKQQVREILDRFKAMEFKTARVTTGEHPFFVPAQKMYLACGFRKIKRYNTSGDLRFGSIEYEIDLKDKPETVANFSINN